MQVVDRDSPGIRDKRNAIIIFLDLFKCFDAINRYILFRMLSRYGVRGLALGFVKAYYEGRCQFVSVGEHKSRVLIKN